LKSDRQKEISPISVFAMVNLCFQKITWHPDKLNVDICRSKQKSEEQCQNYVSVIQRIGANSIEVCGTAAYGPSCRVYLHKEGSGYKPSVEESGIGKCPYDPNQNSTTIAINGKIYSASVIDSSGKYPVIYSPPTATSTTMRTQHGDSLWLNDPNFVSSFDYGDKVYFFFRESAVEYINCGKAVYSRVARVCKNDEGGSGMVLHETWTSFFKARLNCSIPGEFPFYFNEIQSTSNLGKGNYMSTNNSKNRTDMIYGIFHTPANSISSSAICAFRFSDIKKSFESTFKEQRHSSSAWLPVPDIDTPNPHPAKHCSNGSMPVIDQTLNFIKEHPLMDRAVPAYGGQPIFIKTNFEFRMTCIAVDWQVEASDGRSYDILFIGTDIGRVLKVVNVAVNAQIETRVIEDIELFPSDSPSRVIQSLLIFREGDDERLVATTRDDIKSIHLQRCHVHTTCRSCVALQDPYCSWSESSCQNTNTGKQHIFTGDITVCDSERNIIIDESEAVSVTPGTPSESSCICSSQNQADNSGQTGNVTPLSSSTTERRVTNDVDNNNIDDNTGSNHAHDNTPEDDNRIPVLVPDHGKQTAGLEVGAATSMTGACTAETLAIATVLSIVIALLVGFVLGYQASRYKHRNDTPYIQRKIEQRKSLNVNDSGFNYCEPTYSAPPEKQLNVVFNPLKQNGGKLPNGSAETKVQSQPHKVKKVYL
jgi:semaphorin 6